MKILNLVCFVKEVKRKENMDSVAAANVTIADSNDESMGHLDIGK